MALEYPEDPNYVVVDSESERDVMWHEGTLCYVRGSNSLYVLESKSWVTLIASGVYVRIVGDTMTGPLVINPTSGTDALTLREGYRVVFDGA